MIKVRVGCHLIGATAKLADAEQLRKLESIVLKATAAAAAELRRRRQRKATVAVAVTNSPAVQSDIALTCDKSFCQHKFR